MIVQLFIVASIYLTTCLAVEDPPIVNITQGQLKGTIEISRNGRRFYQFLGIKYGKVPKRFGLSELADDSWDETKDATKYGPWCLQFSFFQRKVIGVEDDCLILNLYTPEIKNTSAKLPVMVFIHGGGFGFGSANEFGGKYLMNQDVVYVAINYRLGPMGFLNAGVKGAAGNQGLKDQVLALKWVQKNIEKFGGDPNKVTIFGESAGGGSVSLLAISPMAKGLFHAAISQSGAALCPFVDRKEDPLLQARKLAHLMDCPTSDANYMVECLSKIKSSEIVTATQPKHLAHVYFDVYDVPQMYPSVETFRDGTHETNVFMPEAPLKMLSKGNFNKVPWMNGVNAQEGLLVAAAPVLLNSTLLDLTNEEWGRYAPSMFFYHSSARDPCKLSSKIRDFYFQDETIGMNNSEKFVNLNGDRIFFQCAKQTSMLYAKHAPAYLYLFTKGVEHSASKLFGWPDMNPQGLKSPTHGDELQFFFDFPATPYSPGIPKGNPLEEFSDNLIKLWVSFARDGKPTEMWGSEKEWPILNAQEKPTKWMIIDNDIKLQSENSTLSARLEFWDDLLRPMQVKELL